MKATIRDQQALRSVGPYQLAAYLHAQGWKEVERTEGLRAVWGLAQDGEKYELLVPLAHDLRDYALRMAEVLETLETVEERSQPELLRAIETTSSDIIRIVAEGEDGGEFSVPIDAGVSLVANARELVLAAACAAVKPRPVFPTRKPNEATEYLKKVRLGQTERGSFVLNIESPVSPSLQSALPGFPEEEPFERKVTLTLMRALAAAREAAGKGISQGNIEPFTTAVEKGVSANLCDAIVGLHEGAHVRALAISVHWATARAPERHAVVTFTRDVIPVLGEASRLFRASSAREEFELEGVPVKLAREGDQKEGTVTVAAVVDGALRKVRITLPEAEYERAVAAHADRTTISCEGELVRDGRMLTLQNPRAFTVEQDEP